MSRVLHAAAAACLVLLGCTASAATASLPAVASGARPGPEILYAPPPRAPQLENVAPWKAPPILVSGATAYRDGEFLYQDFLLDDHGAAGVRDPLDPFSPADFLFSPKAGALTYPDDEVYANNAADLVELRVKPLARATALRLTLNSLRDPERVAFTVALGGEPGTLVAWPHGAGVRSPAEAFLTVHGGRAELRDASGSLRQPAPSVAVDLERRQFDVRIPQAAWDPGRATVRLAAGVGLWDRAAGAYLAPAGVRTATAPGGLAPSGARLFNMAFRAHEPMPDVAGTGLGLTIADAAVGGMVLGSWWREKQQADTLSGGDVSAFHADVDFEKLRAGADDDGGVPQAGPLNRILASASAPGQGVDHDRACGGISRTDECAGMFAGQLQPYALYVPVKPRPARGWGLTLLLHSLSANYNQYSSSRNQSQLGERGAGSLVATPAGRGPDGFYRDLAEADVFEVWADVARHYELDPRWVAVSGYSMGGFGTFRLLSRWPDLFARGFSVVGEADGLEHLPSLRNTPLMTWAAALDELVNVAGTEETADAMRDLGLRFEHWLFPAADHLSLATNDEYGPGAAFLGEHRVDRNPPHVTYVVDPSTDSERARIRADHAYWLSRLRVRDPEAAPRATVDARSEAFGLGEAPVLGLEKEAGALDGGSRGPQPYLARVREWGEAPATRAADRLVLRATNLAAGTVDARRARLTCAPLLDVVTDGPLRLRMTCRAHPSRRCGRRLAVRLPRVQGGRVVRAVARGKGRVLGRKAGAGLRRVTVRWPVRRAFTLRVRLAVDGSADVPRAVTLVRRVRACR